MIQKIRKQFEQVRGKKHHVFDDFDPIIRRCLGDYSQFAISGIDDLLSYIENHPDPELHVGKDIAAVAAYGDDELSGVQEDTQEGEGHSETDVSGTAGDPESGEACDENARSQSDKEGTGRA